jgi:hypothetical protein
MLEVVLSETLAALAGATAMDSEASATAAVLAREKLSRLKRDTSSFQRGWAPSTDVNGVCRTCYALVAVRPIGLWGEVGWFPTSYLPKENQPSYGFCSKFLKPLTLLCSPGLPPYRVVVLVPYGGWRLV